MNSPQSTLAFDLKHILHPCSQMKDYEILKPLMIKSAQDVYLYTEDGRKIIDAISSWWCKSFGHQHPVLKSALLEQLNHFEHVIFANTSNEVIIQLTQKLIKLMPHLSHVFYAGDGSCAVEVALKMSLQTRFLTNSKRKHFAALSNGYHGETFGALSVSDLSLYKKPYEDALFPVTMIHDLPYVTGEEDPLWFDASEFWDKTEKQLLPLADKLTAIIVEPIVQGAGGMKIYSPNYLNRLTAFAHHHGIHIIADEIMTGVGRAGRMLASTYADIKPDFICLAKGLTAGWLPFSAILFSDEINQHFYADYETGHSFLHSHTYSGHVLGAAIANKVLELAPQYLERIKQIGIEMKRHFEDIAAKTGQLINIRQLGAVVAADLITTKNSRRRGFQVFQEALKRGAFLRNLGDTIYWLPPFNIDDATLNDLKEITLYAITAGKF